MNSIDTEFMLYTSRIIVLQLYLTFCLFRIHMFAKGLLTWSRIEFHSELKSYQFC